MQRRRYESAALARAELAKKRNETTLTSSLLVIFLIGVFVLLLLFFTHLFELTGFAGSITSNAGDVTEIQINVSKPTFSWGGIYGLVLRVSGFTQQLSTNLQSGSIQRADIFFNCIQSDAPGGPEVFASINSTLDFTNVVPASTAMIDQFLGCSGQTYCASNTFTENFSVMIGDTNISNVPGTYTHKYTGENFIFDVGALNMSGKLVFYAHINASIQPGFSSGALVNYQMLLPTRENQTHSYYFFNDPNDACPAGGIGTSVNATVYGYVTSAVDGSVVANATVIFAGHSLNTTSEGFFNLSTLVLPGEYTVVAFKPGFNINITTIQVNFSSYVVYQNLTLPLETTGVGGTVVVNVRGYAADTSGTRIPEVRVWFGNGTTLTNTTGNYSFYTSLPIGQNNLLAFKEGYNNYYALVNISSNTSVVEQIISMAPSSLDSYAFQTGPYTEQNEKIEQIQQIQIEAEKRGQDYWVSTNEIRKQVRQNTFIEEKVSVYNFKGSTMKVFFALSPGLEDLIAVDTPVLLVPPSTYRDLTVTIYGRRPVGIYTGTLTLSGDVEQDIPIRIEVVEKKVSVEVLLMVVDLFKKIVQPGAPLKYKLNLQNLLSDQGYKVALNYKIVDKNDSSVYAESQEDVEIQNSLTLIRELPIPENISEGTYLLKVAANYLGVQSVLSSQFTVSRPLYLYSFFGIPLWVIFLIVSILSFGTLNYYLVKHHLEKKKRYHLTLNYDLLPKPGPRAIKIGRLAETTIPSYLDLDMFTTHGIIAGATGGGKSIAAQVLVEEALLKNMAVVVFDPTAQWSGMLRKCEDKRMLSLYPKYGLKETDARAFPGNVKQIKDAHQAINIKKYINPGQINIFALNKLDPAEIDIFVESAIVSIFRSSPEEHPGLRVLLVFDEVHRLLPKFGGSGKGFLQIERACREFRKWGFGVLLVSQVLSDFVGEIKANINTELLMRAAEENDLERVRERYGEEALRSLVRSDIGVGMVQNAEFNRGLPYFVAFRPILHNTRRLSDEILEKYYKYTETIEDIEYQIEQLEAEKVDIFDLKMELKLIKDKLMTGNFTVVDIYLEGLTPRLAKQWTTLGKKPKQRELQLVSAADVNASAAAAAAEKAKWEKEHAAAPAAGTPAAAAVDIVTKIVKPLTFDNGVSVSSLKELSEVLPGLEANILRVHLKENRHDIADWVSQQIDAELGTQLKATKVKDEMLKLIKAFIDARQAANSKKGL